MIIWGDHLTIASLEGFGVGVVNSKKLSGSELFLTNFGPKVIKQRFFLPGGLNLELHSGLEPQKCNESAQLQI